jgi:hypothetical protein
MIDEKNFMEFFEKEYGVSFVDVNTGRKVLNIIKENRVCERCEHVIQGDGKTLHVGDMVCNNPKSVHVTDFRFSDDGCTLWEVTKNEV